MVKLIISGLLILFNGLAMAESSLILSGQYEYGWGTETFEILAGKVCFYPNAISAKLLPRPKGDNRQPWFCFINTADAKKLFNISSNQHQTRCGVYGTATVQVKNYQLYIEESDGFDTATLQSVKNNTGIKVNSCAAKVEVANPTQLVRFEKNEHYASVRNKMLQAGWQPFHSPDADTCIKGDERCQGRLEMESCTGTGLGNCRFLWVKNGKKIGICTVGDNTTFDDVCK